MTSITGTVNGVTNPKYTYDANGNMTCTSTGTSCSGTVAQQQTYNAFNMTASVINASTALCLSYDSDHMRIAMEARSTNCSGTLASSTTYLNDPASGAMSERVFTVGSSLVWHDFLTVDGHIVAQHTSAIAYTAPLWNNTITWGSGSAHPFTWTATPSPSTSWAYFTLDNLGSIAVVSDGSGTVLERLSYDAWGKRRNSNGSDASCGAVTSTVTTRGYTGHEMLDAICAINANARIYDPTIARFMTADSFVQNPLDGQSLNRYSYVENNPLALVDPSGWLTQPPPAPTQPVTGPEPPGVDRCNTCDLYIGIGVDQYDLRAGSGGSREPRELSGVGFHGQESRFGAPSLDAHGPTDVIIISASRLPPLSASSMFDRASLGDALFDGRAIGERVGDNDGRLVTAVWPSNAPPSPITLLLEACAANPPACAAIAMLLLLKGDTPDAPRANDAIAKPHGGLNHQAAIQNGVAQARAAGATNIRVNQVQANVSGQRVGNNRPDLQYDLDGTHYNIEYDNIWQNAMDHAQQIEANDPTAVTQLYLLQ